jgi:type II restriction enzyme
MIKNKKHIVETIKNCLRNKFQNYKPESENMPFHYRLLGKDRMALFSFIQSLNTTFGISIYEPVAKELAQPNFSFVETQHKLSNKITEEAQKEIQRIINDLSMGKNVDKLEEIERIRRVAQIGKVNYLKSTNVDLFLVDKDEKVYMFDLKTAKPNIKEFESYKRTLLEWIASYFYKYPKSTVFTMIAIPYNPYEPKPYARWTMKGMLDLKYEVKVAEEFWDFLSGNGTYQDLLDCFEQSGIELRDEIDQYFAQFK